MSDIVAPGLPNPRAELAEHRSIPIPAKAARSAMRLEYETGNASGAPHERIVAVAREMFCRDGIHATGVDRILSAAGASKMTLYARFGSKEALVREALRREGAEWRSAFFAEVARASCRPVERLWAVVPALGNWFRGGRFYGCAFINAVAEHTKGEAWLRELAREHQIACLEFLARQAADAGAEAPDDLARQFLLLIDGAVAALMVSGDEAVLSSAGRTARAILMAEGLSVPT